MHDRSEFLEIFNSVRDLAYTEWEAKNGKLPIAKKEDPPTFLDIVNRTLQFAWYIDGYRPPSPAEDRLPEPVTESQEADKEPDA